MTLGNPQDNFDVHKFLRGELEELPPMPNPVVVTGEGEPRFKGVRYCMLLKRSLGLMFFQGGDKKEKVCSITDSGLPAAC